MPLAERIMARLAALRGTDELVEIASGHVDGCLYHGQVSLDFAEALVRSGARVRVPTTLNVSSLDLLHPDRFRGPAETARRARRLMDLYVELGCRPTWTCAPYQLPERPALGQHVAWAESNAIVFANSVLGARTDRYGDFVDVCAAIAGRVPFAGLHRPEARRATVVLDVRALPEPLLARDVLYPVLGHLIGSLVGGSVPAILGLPPGTTEDRLKAVGAGAASSGAVGLFHAVGVTPEAPTLADALQGREPDRTVTVTLPMVTAARDQLSTAADGAIGAVSVGTPHLSLAELARLVELLDGARVHPGVELYLSTHRALVPELEARGWLERCARAGAQLVTDTCTYITPILRSPGPVMTDSAKWAYYAPGNLGVDVVFGSTEECVRSAVEGRVWRDPELWLDA